VLTIAQALFGLPLEAVASALNMDEANVLAAKDSRRPANPAMGIDECLKRCGIKDTTKSLNTKLSTLRTRPSNKPSLNQSIL